MEDPEVTLMKDFRRHLDKYNEELVSALLNDVILGMVLLDKSSFGNKTAARIHLTKVIGEAKPQ